MKDITFCIIVALWALNFVQGNAQFSGCFSAAGCNSGRVPGPTSARECCVDNQQGLYYNDGGSCVQCIVYGWFSPEFTAQERTAGYQQQIGFSKGGSVAPNVHTTVDVRVRENSAILGSDFTITQSPSNFIVIEPRSSPTNYDIRIEFDSVGQEGNEVFYLELEPIGNTDLGSTGIPAELRNLPNTFFSNNLTVIIEDRTAIQFGFSEADFEDVEGDEFIEVIVAKIARTDILAAPVTFRVIPLIVNDALRENMNNGRPLPPDFDPTSSVHARDNDFDRTPLTVTFHAGEVTQRESVRINITDDEINEAREIFVAVFEVASAVDPSLITESTVINQPPATIIRVTDDDDIQVGFEARLYQLHEPMLGDFEQFYQVVLVKSIETEQVLSVGVTGTENTAQLETSEALNDFSVIGAGTKNVFVEVLLQSYEPSRNLDIAIYADTILESVEDFSLTIQPPGSRSVAYTPGPIATTVVNILDNENENGLLIVGVIARAACDIVTAELTMDVFCFNENSGSGFVEASISQAQTQSFEFTLDSELINDRQFVHTSVGLLPTLLTFPAHQTSVRVPFNITDNEIGLEDLVYRVTFTLSNEAMTRRVVPGLRTVAEVQIKDDDVVTLSVGELTYSVAENEGPLEVSYVLNREAIKDVSFDVVNIDGTATGGSVDYDSAGYSLTIPAGETKVFRNIRIIECGFSGEGDENFTSRIHNVDTAGVLLGDSQLTVIILEIDDTSLRAAIGLTFILTFVFTLVVGVTISVLSVLGYQRYKRSDQSTSQTETEMITPPAATVVYEDPEDIKPDPHTQGNLAYGHV